MQVFPVSWKTASRRVKDKLLDARQQQRLIRFAIVTGDFQKRKLISQNSEPDLRAVWVLNFFLFARLRYKVVQQTVHGICSKIVLRRATEKEKRFGSGWWRDQTVEFVESSTLTPSKRKILSFCDLKYKNFKVFIWSQHEKYLTGWDINSRLIHCRGKLTRYLRFARNSITSFRKQFIYNILWHIIN